MTDIGKFLRDVQKIKKMDRADNNNSNDYNRLSDKIADTFSRATSCPGNLANSIFDYWEKQYVFNSTNLAEEPTDENLSKLGAYLAFMDNSDEDAELISADDWKNLAELVNFEAEDLPIEILQDLMGKLLEHGAL